MKKLLSIGSEITFTDPHGTKHTGRVEGRNFSFTAFKGYVVTTAIADSYRRFRWHVNTNHESGYCVTN